MQCQQACELLSAYHDGELPAEQRVALEVHLESCAGCAAELVELRRLSELTSKLDAPHHSRDAALDPSGQSREPSPTSKSRRYAAITILSAVAATALIIIVTGGETNRGHEHEDLAQYWQSFQADPLPVQKRFVARHAGRVVSADEAVREVGFRPAVATRVPELVEIETSYVLNMPCCKCIETICRRADGTTLAVFEHLEKQPGWFPGRPHVNMQCADATCQVTELGNCLAASWPIGNRVVTVVGLRGVDELTRWVKALRISKRGQVPIVRSTLRAVPAIGS